jgi:1,4-alpha-glucan branching enzyme
VIVKALLRNSRRVCVIFSLPSSVRAETIHLVGDWNGWDTTATPLTLNHQEARWQVALELETGRRYRFRYLLDGSEWLDDPHADDRVENPLGSYDSVVDLGGCWEILAS